jgi:hypothetical protein
VVWGLGMARTGRQSAVQRSVGRSSGRFDVVHGLARDARGEDFEAASAHAFPWEGAASGGASGRRGSGAARARRSAGAGAALGSNVPMCLGLTAFFSQILNRSAQSGK